MTDQIQNNNERERSTIDFRKGLLNYVLDHPEEMSGNITCNLQENKVILKWNVCTSSYLWHDVVDLNVCIRFDFDQLSNAYKQLPEKVSSSSIGQEQSLMDDLFRRNLKEILSHLNFFTDLPNDYEAIARIVARKNHLVTSKKFGL